MLEREDGAAATLRQLGATVRTLDLWDDPINLFAEDDPDDDDRMNSYVKIRETRGRIAQAQAFDWPSASIVGRVGDMAYAVRKLVGKGVVIGVANDDLFTNVGVLPKHNAAMSSR